LFTLTTVPQPLNQIRPIVEGAVHPPLYFFLLHFWIQIPWPASPLAKMRATSVLWTMLATIILDRLWLMELEPRVRRMFLALWVLSPCLLLYSRTARSYSMQLALALPTIYAASKWLARPQKSAMAPGVFLLSGRASIHAKSARAGNYGRSLAGIPGETRVVAEDPPDAICCASSGHRAFVPIPVPADLSLQGRLACGERPVRADR
jgi:hypothetical protein